MYSPHRTTSVAAAKSWLMRRRQTRAWSSFLRSMRTLPYFGCWTQALSSLAMMRAMLMRHQSESGVVIASFNIWQCRGHERWGGGGGGAEEAGNKVEHRALAALLLPPPAFWREIKKCRVSERMGWWTCFMCCWCGSKDWLCWCGQPPPPPFSMLSFGICSCLSLEQIKGQLPWPFSVASVLLNGTLILLYGLETNQMIQRTRSTW